MGNTYIIFFLFEAISNLEECESKANPSRGQLPLFQEENYILFEFK